MLLASEVRCEQTLRYKSNSNQENRSDVEERRL